MFWRLLPHQIGEHMKPEEVKVGDVKILDSTPPAGTKISSSMTMEATVDVKPQPLLKLRPFILAVKAIPATLPPEAQIVLQNLLSCFEKQKNVSEGLIGDVMFGFNTCGIPPQCTYEGLRQLAKEGYLKFQAKDNSWVNIESEAADGAFVRYQKKLLDMVYV
jgi:hypothetical protein